jgi:hypothetical protein
MVYTGAVKLKKPIFRANGVLYGFAAKRIKKHTLLTVNNLAGKPLKAGIERLYSSSP